MFFFLRLVGLSTLNFLRYCLVMFCVEVLEKMIFYIRYWFCFFNLLKNCIPECVRWARVIIFLIKSCADHGFREVIRILLNYNYMLISRSVSGGGFSLFKFSCCCVLICFGWCFILSVLILFVPVYTRFM